MTNEALSNETAFPILSESDRFILRFHLPGPHWVVTVPFRHVCCYRIGRNFLTSAHSMRVPAGTRIERAEVRKLRAPDHIVFDHHLTPRTPRKTHKILGKPAESWNEQVKLLLIPE